MANTKLKAILFDYDGTLRDSKALIYASLEHAFKVNDIPQPNDDELAPHLHHHHFVHEAIAPEVPYEDFAGPYYDKKNELMPSVGTYPGTAQVLRQLQKTYRLGLVTAAKDARSDLERLGIEQYFELVIGAEDLREHKPHPEGLNLALERLGISAKDAVYVGDMSTDIYATKAAKLRTAVGVTTGFANRRELETAGADYIIDSLNELPAILANIEQ